METPTWKIWYDSLAQIAKGQVQDQLQAETVEAALNNLQALLKQYADTGDANVKAELNQALNDLETELRIDIQKAMDDAALARSESKALIYEKMDGVATAYDVAVKNGYTGTESEWLASLKGDRGPAGPYGGTEVADPQVASYVRDAATPTETRKALNDNFLQRIFTRPSTENGYLVNIIDESADTSGASTIRITDTPANSGSLLNLYHKGNGGTQSYGLNIANMPDAKGALVIHQYSKRNPAVQIDNTDVNTGIYIKNTENQTMNPGNTGTGAFMQFLPYGETGGLSLTNGLIWLNNSKKDMKVQAVNPKTYGFGVQMDGDKTGLQVMKNGTGPGNATWITNAGTGHALFVSQSGAAEAMHIYSDQVGRYTARFRGNNYGSVVTTQEDGGVTADFQKNGTGGGIVTRIINKGTGAFLSAIATQGEMLRIHANGEVELFGLGAGIIMRSPNGGRYRVTVDDSGNLKTVAA